MCLLHGYDSLVTSKSYSPKSITWFAYNFLSSKSSNMQGGQVFTTHVVLWLILSINFPIRHTTMWIVIAQCKGHNYDLFGSTHEITESHPLELHVKHVCVSYCFLLHTCWTTTLKLLDRSLNAESVFSVFTFVTFCLSVRLWTGHKADFIT